MREGHNFSEGPDEGFTLIEMMVAVLLLAIILPAFAAALISSTFATADAHLKQVAVTLSTTALDNARAVVPAGSLLTEGSAVGTVPAGVDLSQTTGAVALGTEHDELNNRLYTTLLFAGTCYLQSPTGSAGIACDTTKTQAPMIRVIADVTWPAPSGCPQGTCSYVTSTLISNGSDSVLNVNPGVAPNTPTNVTAAPGPSEVTVSWTIPTSALPITGFVATASPGGARCSTTGASTCTISGLTGGTSYEVSVVAASSAGTSPPSSPVAATPAGS